MNGRANRALPDRWFFRLALVVPLALSACSPAQTSSKAPKALPVSIKANPQADDLERSVLRFTGDADTATCQFLRVVETETPERSYGLTAPAYRKRVSRADHRARVSAWLQRGSVRECRLVDRSVGLAEAGRYVYLRYQVKAAKYDGMLYVILAPVSGQWQVSEFLPSQTPRK
jgi:hypothetical protein